MINLNHPVQTHKYMSSALFIENKYSANVRKRTLSQKIEFGMTSLTFLTLILIAIVSLVYLAHSNGNATKGYALKNLERRRSELLTQNEVLDMQIAQAKSLQSLQSDPKIKMMVRADQPMFVRGDSAIASK